MPHQETLTKQRVKTFLQCKGADRQIKQAKGKYENLLRNIPDAIYFALPDETGAATFIAGRWKDWTGYSPEDFYRDFEILLKTIHPEDREKAIQSYTQAHKEKKEYVFEYRVVHKDTGEVRYLRDHGVPVKNEKGEIVRFNGIITDITERKQSEEYMRRLAAVVRDSNDAVTIQDFEGKIIAWNHGAEKMYGWSEEEALRMNACDIVPKAKSQETLDFIKKLSRKETVESFETQRITKDGRLLDVWMTVTLLVDDAGKPVAVAMTERDITERKQAEKERECLNAELEKKNKELEQIVHITSHDLRSPLVNVCGFTKELDSSLKELFSVIQSESVPVDVREKVAFLIDEDIPESIQYILNSASQMDSLLSGLLRLSYSGRAVIKIEELDMNKLISHVAKTFEFRIKETGVELKISELPPCKGDMMHINQVFSNLLDNALKYFHPDCPGIIGISGYKEKDQSVYCVEDNGIGIAPEHQKKIFEIFHQLNPAMGAGAGLGLTIVSRILDRHSGKVWVESEPGKGSKFFISLPNT
jgi:PAS domain S-box-containing protein